MLLSNYSFIIIIKHMNKINRNIIMGHAKRCWKHCPRWSLCYEQLLHFPRRFQRYLLQRGINGKWESPQAILDWSPRKEADDKYGNVCISKVPFLKCIQIRLPLSAIYRYSCIELSPAFAHYEQMLYFSQLLQRAFSIKVLWYFTSFL